MNGTAKAPGGLCVVAGASGGIGRALCDALISADRFVVAISRRRPAGWSDGPRRAFFAADLLDEGQLAAAADGVKALGTPDLVIVASGRLHGPGLAPEKTYRALTAPALTDILAANAIAPALTAKHFLPLTPRSGRSVFAALSARVGSIGDNRLGGWYSYRAAKAALNQIIRTLAIEQARSRPDAVVAALHPGTVATALSAPFAAGARGKTFTTAEAAERLLHVMDALTPDQSGGFYGWDGAPITW